METLGQFLKREREFRGISLEDLSQRTRLNVVFLRQMEEDRFHEMPRGAFVKGFLKSYSQELGLNENEVLSRYQGLGGRSPSVENPFKNLKGFEVKNQVVVVLLFLIGLIVVATLLSSR